MSSPSACRQAAGQLVQELEARRAEFLRLGNELALASF